MVHISSNTNFKALQARSTAGNVGYRHITKTPSAALYRAQNKKG